MVEMPVERLSLPNLHFYSFWYAKAWLRNQVVCYRSPFWMPDFVAFGSGYLHSFLLVAVAANGQFDGFAGRLG